MLEKTTAFYSEKVLNENTEINFKEDINAIDRYGDTILMHACSHENLDVVEELLAVPGIDIFHKNGRELNAILCAIPANDNCDQSFEIIARIMNHKDFLSAEQGLKEIIK